MARNPWEQAMNRLVEVLGWKKALAWRDGSGAHINVLELRGKRKVVSRMARRERYARRRHGHLIDSRVAQGASGKGRSPARKINRELRLMLPDL